MALKPCSGEMWPGYVFGVTDPGTPSGTVKVNSLHKWVIWAQLLDNGADLWHKTQLCMKLTKHPSEGTNSERLAFQQRPLDVKRTVRLSWPVFATWVSRVQSDVLSHAYNHWLRSRGHVNSPGQRRERSPCVTLLQSGVRLGNTYFNHVLLSPNTHGIMRRAALSTLPW